MKRQDFEFFKPQEGSRRSQKTEVQISVVFFGLIEGGDELCGSMSLCYVILNKGERRCAVGER
jgi:hypothetical protein